MLASASLGLPKTQPPPIPPVPEPNPPSDSSPSRPQSPSDHGPRKLKPSPKLNLWSRSRSIRSGRKMDRPANRVVQTAAQVANYPPPLVRTEDGVSDSERTNEEDNGDMREEKAIYMVSDGTGWTAEHSVNAALGQFEHCLVDRGCPVNTHLFSGNVELDLWRC